MTELTDRDTDMIYEATSTPPVDVSRLAAYEVHTPDLERMVDYYEHSLGLVVTERSAETAYLTTASDHHCVVVRRGEADGRAALTFELSRSLDETAERLESAGLSVERQTDPDPGVAAALVVTELGTGTPLSLVEGQAPSAAPSVIAGRPTKLGHVASYVEDLAASQRFYLEVLGFRWSDMMGDFFTFLRCNADHHAINLMQSSKKRGLFHVAFEMRDFMHLKDQLDHLSSRGHALDWGPGRHGIGHNIFTYHRDPDGNYVELFCEIDLIFDERTGHFEPRPWHETFPQGPKVWTPQPTAANKWGIVNPEMQDH